MPVWDKFDVAKLTNEIGSYGSVQFSEHVIKYIFNTIQGLN